MAHYAFIDNSSTVVEVIAGVDEAELIDGLDPEAWYSNFRGQTCKRSSYNGKIRYNYAAVGMTYDTLDDAFIAPMPECGHDELLLNDLKRWECATCEAEAKQVSDPA